MKTNTKDGCENKFTFKVFDENLNLVELKSDDPILTGQQILEKAQKYQTDDYILVQQQADGMLEERNLSEPVDMSDEGIESFFIFKSDRIFYFKLNGRKMPWGSNEINETLLRRLGNIPDNHQLFLQEQSEADALIADGRIIDLDNPGLERIYSKEREDIEIIVNGRPKKVTKAELSYLEIVKLAFPDAVLNQGKVYTTTFKRGCCENPEGSLVEGDVVCITDGEVFNVTPTDKS